MWYEVYAAVPLAGEQGNIMRVGDEITYFWPTVRESAKGWVNASSLRGAEKLAKAAW